MVNVLISTYNGEKYIRKQIESIQAQTYPDITIYVRDDGSSDSTCAILEEYALRKEIIYQNGENVGYGRSFGKLLKQVEEGDFWAFCDQDDVWLPQKVERAVAWLERQDDTIPALFGNAYELTDETLEKNLGLQLPPSYKLDFRRALTDCVYQGFAMTFNRPLRELMLRADMDKITSHDWWAQILAVKYGLHYFDPQVTVKHRRLNTSISGMNMANRFSWLFRTLKTGDTGIRSCASQYEETFGRLEDDKDAKIARWFVGEHYDLIKSFKKAFYPGRWRPALSSELVLRFLMLLGRV